MNRSPSGIEGSAPLLSVSFKNAANCSSLTRLPPCLPVPIWWHFSRPDSINA